MQNLCLKITTTQGILTQGRVLVSDFMSCHRIPEPLYSIGDMVKPAVLSVCYASKEPPELYFPKIVYIIVITDWLRYK